MNRRSHTAKIVLAGIQIKACIGANASERSTPQDCDADVVVWGDFEAAAFTDDLSKAIDYTKILEKVLETAGCRKYCLLETLAQSITRALLQSFPVSKVAVKIRKRPAALADKLDYVQVELEESW